MSGILSEIPEDLVIILTVSSVKALSSQVSTGNVLFLLRVYWIGYWMGWRMLRNSTNMNIARRLNKPLY